MTFALRVRRTTSRRSRLLSPSRRNLDNSLGGCSKSSLRLRLLIIYEKDVVWEGCSWSATSDDEGRT